MDAAAGESDVSLASIGLGVRVRGALDEIGFFNAGYGWQVGQSGFEDDESGLMHIQATIRW